MFLWRQRPDVLPWPMRSCLTWHLSTNFCRSSAHASPFLSVPASLIFLAFLRYECVFSCPRAFAHADPSAQKGLLFYSASSLHTNVFFKEALDLPQTRSECSVVCDRHTMHSFFLTLQSSSDLYLCHCLINVYLAHHDSYSTYPNA